MMAARLACWLSVLAIAAVSLLPWGNSETLRLALPLLPLVAMLVWHGVRPQAISPLLPFVAGIVVDAAAHAPLGFWAIVYLAAFGVALLLHDDAGERSALSVWRGVASLTVVGGLAAWMLASLYELGWQPWRNYVSAAAATALVVPAFMLVLWPLARLGRNRRRLQFERRG